MKRIPFVFQVSGSLTFGSRPRSRIRIRSSGSPLGRLSEFLKFFEYSLFVLLASFLMISSSLAAKIPLVSDQAEKVEPIKPIKVSELNANLFSDVYDFLKEAGSSLFEGVVSLKDFFETGE